MIRKLSSWIALALCVAMFVLPHKNGFVQWMMADLPVEVHIQHLIGMVFLLFAVQGWNAKDDD